MTADRYLEMQSQLGQEPVEEDIPPSWEDFPDIVIDAVNTFNQLGDRCSFSMIHAACSLLCSMPGALIAQEFQTPITERGVPDLQGYWKNNTITPFERPQKLGDKQAYTEK